MLFKSVDDLVVRAKQIGLTANDPELSGIVEHLLDCIHGRITVHESINPAIGRLLASGMLRQLIANHPAQEPYTAALAGAVFRRLHKRDV
jgi:Mg2+/Co2+ transporter CorB